MLTASRLAGFFAAHAIWCVSEGDTLIPMLAYTSADGERHVERLVGEDLGDAVAQGKERLAANAMDATDAALVYDGFLPLGDEKLDAIIIEMRAYFSPDSEVVIAIPYTPKSSGSFRIHHPKLLVWKNCDDFDPDDALDAFFEGVSEHEEGAKIWVECFDGAE